MFYILDHRTIHKVFNILLQPLWIQRGDNYEKDDNIEFNTTVNFPGLTPSGHYNYEVVFYDDEGEVVDCVDLSIDV